MGHDSTKVVLGGTRSSYKVVEPKVASATAANNEAGKGVLAGTIFEGISIGPDLSRAGMIQVCKAGLKVPVQLKAAFTPTIDTQVSIDSVTLLACPSGDTNAVAVNAIYKSAVLTGIKEDNTETPVALIDMVGGL